MVRVDLSGNARMPGIMTLVAELSRAREPSEVLRVFAERSQEIWGPRGYISLSTRDLPHGSYRITRKLLDFTPSKLTDVDSWTDRDRFAVHAGGLLGEIVESGGPQILHHVFLRDDPVLSDELADFGSILAIPLHDDGEPRNWAITLAHEAEKFEAEGLEEVVLRSNLVGGTVGRAVITRKLADANAAIQAEVDKIASIQRALLPSGMPDIPGLQIGANYETFDRAGGDYYDFIRLPGEDRWGLLVADASGHGPAAAVMMAMLHALMHAFASGLDEGCAGAVLEHVNRHLARHHVESSFVTAFYGIYDAKSRRLDWARAGHPPPVLMRACSGGGWRIDRLDAIGGVPLGILEDVTYETATTQLAPGQTLVLYTDGITEARCPEGHMFGIDGIERSLTECTGEPNCVIGHITGALKEHERAVCPDDDQTIVVVRLEA